MPENEIVYRFMAYYSFLPGLLITLFHRRLGAWTARLWAIDNPRWNQIFFLIGGLIFTASGLYRLLRIAVRVFR